MFTVYSFIVLIVIGVCEFAIADFRHKYSFKYPGVTATFRLIEAAFVGVWFYFLINPNAMLIES